MPNICCVKGCNKLPPNVTLHRFPKDATLCEKWKGALEMSTVWLPTESDRVCSSHFDPAIKIRCKAQVRLLAGAVPGITAILPNAEVKNDTHDQ